MSSRLTELFEDDKLTFKVKLRLPYLFQLAELESSRAGKVGMEVGSARERVVIALLIYKFGEQNVDTRIPITEPEVDARLFGVPVSIKTITGKKPSGVKLIWTVDQLKAKEFLANYFPSCDMLLIHINWGGQGGFYYLPVEAQQRVFNEMGRTEYIKLPVPGTNPRGVEITRAALDQLLLDPMSRKVPISWQRQKVDFNPFKRWVDLWKED